MTYTQWNQEMATLGIATSPDLEHWIKWGYAFRASMPRIWSKSGSIVCRQVGERLVATKIQGKYWMYWGDRSIYAAVSSDLLVWTSVGPVMHPREGYFDSLLVEPGPPALLTEKGILLLYNAGNSAHTGDPEVPPDAYSAGQVLFNRDDPLQILQRSERCFFTPTRAHEQKGQYAAGTVFVQGLVPFQGKWFLYYGAADSSIGVACANQ
jgi:predicted GH43/DUF377 family glycosyl hydrolase